MAEICLSSITLDGMREEEDKDEEEDGKEEEGDGGISFKVVLANSVNLVNQCFQSMEDNADDTEEDVDGSLEEEEDDDEDEDEGKMDPVITGVIASEEMKLLIPLRDSRLPVDGNLKDVIRDIVRFTR